jgi:hypothetical protein
MINVYSTPKNIGLNYKRVPIVIAQIHKIRSRFARPIGKSFNGEHGKRHLIIGSWPAQVFVFGFIQVTVVFKYQV